MDNIHHSDIDNDGCLDILLDDDNETARWRKGYELWKEQGENAESVR